MSEQKQETPRLDDEEALALLAGAENDCPCLRRQSIYDYCQSGKCYHRTGEGVCLECADGYGITVPSLLRIGYQKGFESAITKAARDESEGQG